MYLPHHRDAFDCAVRLAFVPLVAAIGVLDFSASSVQPFTLNFRGVEVFRFKDSSTAFVAHDDCRSPHGNRDSSHFVVHAGRTGLVLSGCGPGLAGRPLPAPPRCIAISACVPARVRSNPFPIRSAISL